MLSIFGNFIHVWLFLIGIFRAVSGVDSLIDGAACETRDRSPGTCKLRRECPSLIDTVTNKNMSLLEPVGCGYSGTDELLCCPSDGWNKKSIINSSSNSKPKDNRPSVAACKIIEENLEPTLIPHILEGAPMGPGEYPHMAAIGYEIIGNETAGRYFRCSGTLIHERFVLTAAHCVITATTKPVIVRFGEANFNGPVELPRRVEIPIMKIYVHPEYSRLQKLNDIALIELERPIERTAFIAPTCLYTEDVDPPADAHLYTVGWGVYNGLMGSSSMLLKAKMSIMEENTCKSFLRRFGIGRSATQQCVSKIHKTNEGGACLPDLAGSLTMTVDYMINNYRLVGILASGDGCEPNVPVIYTKMSAYLEFIESIVWPSN